jgi:RNA polymerase subunit RPABC4/transcription elongation factor Spt4
MLFGIRTKPDPATLSLLNAVLCVDCESVSSTPTDECPVCGSRAILSLVRMLGGSLLVRRAERSNNADGGLRFDVDIAIALKQVEGKDMNVVLQGITNLIGPKLRQGASFHVSVEPVAVDDCAESIMKAA